MKHYITLILAGLAFVAILLTMFFRLNPVLIIPALVAFQVMDNAYEAIKEEEERV